jgi:hypothetical protein
VSSEERIRKMSKGLAVIIILLVFVCFGIFALYDTFDAPAVEREAINKIERARELTPNKHGQYAESIDVSIPTWMEKYPDRKVIAIYNSDYGSITIVYECPQSMN